MLVANIGALSRVCGEYYDLLEIYTPAKETRLEHASLIFGLLDIQNGVKKMPEFDRGFDAPNPRDMGHNYRLVAGHWKYMPDVLSKEGIREFDRICLVVRADRKGAYGSRRNSQKAS